MISRKSGSIKGKYTVLIVCEGQNTEPAYFSKFETYLNSNYSHEYPKGISFTIFPFPPEETQIRNEADQFTTRTKNKKELQNPEKIINDDIEDQYRPEPTRWVRYAQKKAENSGFNEVWSVFDYDNRADDEIKTAFDLADNEEFDFGKVKIAFSSYSFEYWLLLHYELFEKNLIASECKDENRDEINCGDATCAHPNNCKGIYCLGGYLRSQLYDVGFYNKTKDSTFPALIDKIKIARYNSVYVRHLPKNTGLETWTIKPITTMDKLIDGLTKEPNLIYWHYEKGKIALKNIEIKASKNEKYIQVEIIRKSTSSFILPSGKIKILDLVYNEIPINVRVQIITDTPFILPQIDILNLGLTPKYISVEIDRKINIVEIL